MEESWTLPWMPIAMLTNSGGHWHLYVVLMDATEWPEYDWQRAAPSPTVAEREQALAELGYVIAARAIWGWSEDLQICDDPTSPSLLLASISVRPITDRGR
ncbi:DUF6303 family protein [Streptomyces sp. NPDC006733]|uniref:DUF6303 family protein n=1 Tax=Streptomyces sp. NPDC006733 TaxID=3155460 RepID=UPI0033ED1586